LRLIIRMDTGKSKAHSIHRLVAWHFVPLPAGKQAAQLTVNHLDGNKRNNHKDNLNWLTMKENNWHAIATGLRDTQKLYFETPLGIFGSSSQAAKAHGTYKEKIERWCKSGKKIEQGWDYLPRLGRPITFAPVDVLSVAVVAVAALWLPAAEAKAYQYEDDNWYWCECTDADGYLTHTEAATTIGEAFRIFYKSITFKIRRAA
jgi:hypothetical protein